MAAIHQCIVRRKRDVTIIILLHHRDEAVDGGDSMLAGGVDDISRDLARARWVAKDAFLPGVRRGISLGVFRHCCSLPAMIQSQRCRERPAAGNRSVVGDAAVTAKSVGTSTARSEPARLRIRADASQHGGLDPPRRIEVIKTEPPEWRLDGAVMIARPAFHRKAPDTQHRTIRHRKSSMIRTILTGTLSMVIPVVAFAAAPAPGSAQSDLMAPYADWIRELTNPTPGRGRGRAFEWWAARARHLARLTA